MLGVSPFGVYSFSFRPLFGVGGGDNPDPGFVFVFLANGMQLYTFDDFAVQVPESYANA